MIGLLMIWLSAIVALVLAIGIIWMLGKASDWWHDGVHK